MTKTTELSPTQHHTLTLSDYHFLGTEGMPHMHQTRQRIRALAPITHIPYRFDTDQLSVEGVGGCQAGEVYEEVPGIFAVNLNLDEPLETGEEAMIDYVTHFCYPERPQSVFRRAVGARAVDLSIDVIFDGRCMPTNIWQSTWAGYQPDSPVVAENLVIPQPFHADSEDDFAVHFSQEGLQHTVAGFRWEWPE